MVAHAARDGELTLEIRQRLSETDERGRQTLRGKDALRGALTRLFEQRLEVTGEPQAVGDCLDLRPKGMEPGRLYVTRVCFAAREGLAPRLSYLGLAEAR